MPTRRPIDPRRLATARLALDALDTLPGPDQQRVYTGWVAWRLGVEHGLGRTDLLRALNRLARAGLADKAHSPDDEPWLWASDSGPCYWRQTQAGHTFDGTAHDLARPIRWR